MIVSFLMALGQTGLQLRYFLKSFSILPGHFLVLQKGKVMLSYLPIILRGDSLKPTHSSFFPEEIIELFSSYKGQIFCYWGTTFAIVVGDATNGYNSKRGAHYCSDRGYTDSCVYSM